MYPATLESLALWEQKLDKLNEKCTVPKDALSRVFDLNELEPILQRKLVGMAAVNYVNPNSQFSNRYINEGWNWAQVLSTLPQPVDCVELCPGKSIVLDLALAFNNFSGLLTKIDYRTWASVISCKIKSQFKCNLMDLNVLTQTNLIPGSQLILLNHVIDDLLMGLWGERHQYDFFGVWSDWDEVDRCWTRVIDEGFKPYLPTLKKFMKHLSEKITVGGHIVLRDYPSAYECSRKQVDRVNFSRNLTLTLIQELVDAGMTQLASPAGETFFILRK